MIKIAFPEKNKKIYLKGPPQSYCTIGEMFVGVGEKYLKFNYSLSNEESEKFSSTQIKKCVHKIHL